MDEGGGPSKSRNRPAAFTLLALTPLIAELALGSTPVRMAWLVLLWVPIYGAGVLAIRELVARRGRGWASILLLACAYELLEDGVGLQALTSPHLYGAAEWGLRPFGLNLPYWEANLIYHAVFTVAIPIALTGLIFPAHGRRPYLGRTGLVVACAVAFLGVLVLRVTVPLSQDPGYQLPLPALLGFLALVAALVVVALVIVPPSRTRRPVPGPVPSPAVLGVAGGVATLLFFVLTFPMFGARQPAFTQGAWVILPMLAAAALAAFVAFALARLTASPAWTSRHTLWLIGGALLAHTAGGLVIMAHTLVDQAGLLVIAGVTVAALLTLDRRLVRLEQASLRSPRPPSAASVTGKETP